MSDSNEEDRHLFIADPMFTFSEMKIYLNGLVKRDVSTPAPDPVWLASPEGQAWKAKQEERRAAFSRGDLKLAQLHEIGSLKIVEVDRLGLLALVNEGWIFDDETMAWAEETSR